MSEPQKKRRRPIWSTVVLVILLLAYPLSFGPWCWLVVRHPDGIGYVSNPSSFYKPIIRVWFESGGNSTIGSMIGWYANVASLHELNPGKEDDGTFCVAAGSGP